MYVCMYVCIYDTRTYVMYVEVEYCFTSHQLIYGYLQTDDDNNYEIDTNPDLNFKDKGFFYTFTSHTT